MSEIEEGRGTLPGLMLSGVQRVVNGDDATKSSGLRSPSGHRGRVCRTCGVNVRYERQPATHESAQGTIYQRQQQNNAICRNMAAATPV